MSSHTLRHSSCRQIAQAYRHAKFQTNQPLLQTRRHSGKSVPHATSHQAWSRQSAVLFAAAATIALVYTNSRSHQVQAEAPATDPPEIRIEKPRKKKESKEENRDMISSQHLQVKRSWEYPGVYIWGSNTGKVAAPGSDEAYVKSPQRLSYFDDLLLRDLKLDRNFGAALLENGDLVQWGRSYTEDTSEPSVTLKGKDLNSIQISRDRIIALARNGTVYSIPVSKSDQENGHKLSESTWIPFSSTTADISYRKLQPQNLGSREKVIKISSGLEHVLLLTNAGRVFSAASGTQDFPSRGQLGVPGITWLSRPVGAYDMCHELTTLRGFDIASIATGDYHSLVLDKQGRAFSWGDNSSGQLGFDYNSESPFIDSPSLLAINKLYQGTSQIPQVTNISAGGANSFFSIDATRVAHPTENPADVRTLNRVTADTWAAGEGIKGSLGNGKWTHVQGRPTKVPSLSGLFEYDEKAQSVIPIRMAQISVGSNHASAVMDNVTYLNASERGTENDTNWGADVLWWGGNEYYQLGTGKRNNVATPQYIRPLDMAAEIEAGRREEHRFHATPKHKVSVKGRKVSMEQRVECGRNVTAVYSGL